MVTLVVCSTGTAGIAFLPTRRSSDLQVLSVVDRSVTLCNPGATPVNVAEAWNAPPSRLYSYAPVGADRKSIPVNITHVGIMFAEAVVAKGTGCTALMVRGVALEKQGV